MIGLGLLRGAFLGGIMMWYSMSVWKTVDQYFRDQFQDYLKKEYEQNEAMKKDVLMEKERLAARGVMVEGPDFELDSKFVEQLERGLGDYGTSDGEEPYSSGYETEDEDEGGFGYADHGSYSPEEVRVERGRVETGEGTAVLEDFEVVGARPPPFGDDVEAGECAVDDGCSGDGDQVSTRWRNVFDEEAEVCRFDQHVDAQGPCSQPDEKWEEP